MDFKIFQSEDSGGIPPKKDTMEKRGVATNSVGTQFSTAMLGDTTQIPLKSGMGLQTVPESGNVPVYQRVSGGFLNMGWKKMLLYAAIAFVAYKVFIK